MITTEEIFIKKYINSNFIQTGIFLESIIKDNLTIKCLEYQSKINLDEQKESYWRKEAFKVFGYDWYNFNYMLPKAYSNSSKKDVIMKHSRNTKIFGLRGLVSLKSNYDNITFSEYKKYKKEMNAAVHNKFVFYGVLCAPRFICKFIIKLASK